MDMLSHIIGGCNGILSGGGDFHGWNSLIFCWAEKVREVFINNGDGRIPEDVFITDIKEKYGEEVASIVKEVTNDKDETAKIGKERYISEELCRLSPEALTVKLADMFYNMKDSPTEKNYERMRKMLLFL